MKVITSWNMLVKCIAPASLPVQFFWLAQIPQAPFQAQGPVSGMFMNTLSLV
jgi:hypothetical protein